MSTGRPFLSVAPTILERMFEAIPFAVAMSPVVRVADPPGPRNDSAAKLAMVGVLTPGPVAMDLLTQVQDRSTGSTTSSGPSTWWPGSAPPAGWRRSG